MQVKSKKPDMNRGKKRHIGLWIVLCLVIALLVCTLIFFTHPFFRIKYVRVLGNETISSKELLSGVEEMNENVLLYSPKDLEAHLSTVKGVEQFSVKKEFPNRLTVTIKERYIVGQGEKETPYFMDQDGFVTEKMPENVLNRFAPIPVAGVKFVPGKQAFSDDRAIALLKALYVSPLNGSIEQVHFENIDNIDIMYKGMIIHFGAPNDLNEKIAVMTAVIKDIEHKKIKAKEIILNQGDHPIVVTEIEN